MNNKFNIKDIIYHVTPESPAGVILDVWYSMRTETYEYTVVFDCNSQTRCIEDELSKTKVFI